MTTSKNPAERALKSALTTGCEGKYLLRLYVAGATARSRQALRRVYQLCEERQKGNYELEVIDVYQQPELARENQIVATPTLVRRLPLPVRKFIGNMANIKGLFEALEPAAGCTKAT